MTNTTGWEYTETTLQQRIEIHEKYSKYEINDWIKVKINLKPGEKVLDIGCGNGKQAILYAGIVGSSGEVFGIDIAQDLLDVAKNVSKDVGLDIKYLYHDANNPLPFESEKFEAISCCFSIYYYSDIKKTLDEMMRVLKKGGRIFIAGPTVNNAHEMLSVYAKVAGKKIPQIREERIRDKILPLIKNTFTNVSVDVFKNPIEFPDSDTFLRYFTSTLLIQECKDNPVEMSNKLSVIEKEIDKIIHDNGKFVVTKEVYGITGYKL